MTLEMLLKVIAHENYNVILRDVNFMNQEREIYNCKDIDKKGELLKRYLNYSVVCLDQDWNIIIKGELL